MHSPSHSFVAYAFGSLLLASTTLAAPSASPYDADFVLEARADDDGSQPHVWGDLSLTSSMGLKNSTYGSNTTLPTIPIMNGSMQDFLLNAARWGAGQTNEGDPDRQLPATDYLRYSNANLSFVISSYFDESVHTPLNWTHFVDVVTFASSSLYARQGNTSFGGSVLLFDGYKPIADWWVGPSFGDQNYTGASNSSQSNTSGGNKKRRSVPLLGEKDAPAIFAPASGIEKRQEKNETSRTPPGRGGRGRKLAQTGSFFGAVVVPLPAGSPYNMTAAKSDFDVVPYSLMDSLSRTALANIMLDCPYDKDCTYYQYTTTIGSNSLGDSDVDDLPGTYNGFQMKFATGYGMKKDQMISFLNGLVQIAEQYEWGMKNGTRASLYGEFVDLSAASSSSSSAPSSNGTVGWWSLGTQIGYNYEEDEGADGVDPCTPTGQRGGEKGVKGCFIRKVEYLTKPTAATSVAALFSTTAAAHTKPPVSPTNPPPPRNSLSLFRRIFFPRTRLRARARLSAFRHETLPYYGLRAQSRIYRFILARQAKKQERRRIRQLLIAAAAKNLPTSSVSADSSKKGRRGAGILTRLGGRKGLRRILLASLRGKDAVSVSLQARAKTVSSTVARSGIQSGQASKGDMEGEAGFGGAYSREPGARRRKLAGYLKAANELRQTYQAAYRAGRDEENEDGGAMPGSYVDGTVVRSGDEEMLLFPSYARRHTPSKSSRNSMVKEEKPDLPPGVGENAQDGAGGPGDAEYWKREWERYEDAHAIVDVDIRGWVFAPQRGQMTRKNRILVGMARRLSGIPAPDPSRGSSPSSPHPARISRDQEDELAEKEARKLELRGRGEADRAVQGAYNEAAVKSGSNAGNSPYESRESSPRPLKAATRQASSTSLRTSQQRAPTWTQPADMTPDELAVANDLLMKRLRPFLTTPMVSIPLTVFFYNDDTSKSRTVTTNDSGHFTYRAALDFIPTHVRVLASDKLSATEKVKITEPTGVTVISDIDDTIKHSAISAGAREIFRNAFIRELEKLTVDGVKEWYQTLADMGVTFHYVSNSPWQFYPVLTSFFQAAGLPKGSYHLKQYSGMLQGIFEPVAERKKGSLDRIISDFPERKFILVGDSGEADLELYTDIMLANPGKILAVYIRDVTTSQSTGFFESASQGQLPQFQDRPKPRGRPAEQSSTAPQPPERRPALPPRPPTRSASTLSTPSATSAPPTEKLIDYDDEAPAQSINYTNSYPSSNSELLAGNEKSPPPSRPSKPLALRPTAKTEQPQQQEQSSSAPSSSISRKPAPPRPPKPQRYTSSSSLPDNNSTDNNNAATTTSSPSDTSSPVQSTTATSQPRQNSSSSSSKASNPDIPTSQNSTNTIQPPPQTYTTAVRNKVASAYASLPSFYASNLSTPLSHNLPSTLSSTSSSQQQQQQQQRKKPAPPPPPGPRRAGTGLRAQPSTSEAPAPISTNGAGGVSSSNASTASTSWFHTYTTGHGGGGGGGGEGDENAVMMTKKEELWLRRWERAKALFREKGVVLRSWRTGEDVAGECVGLVEGAMRRQREGGKEKEKGEKVK